MGIPGLRWTRSTMVVLAAPTRKMLLIYWPGCPSPQPCSATRSPLILVFKTTRVLLLLGSDRDQESRVMIRATIPTTTTTHMRLLENGRGIRGGTTRDRDDMTMTAQTRSTIIITARARARTAHSSPLEKHTLKPWEAAPQVRALDRLQTCQENETRLPPTHSPPGPKEHCQEWLKRLRPPKQQSTRSSACVRNTPSGQVDELSRTSRGERARAKCTAGPVAIWTEDM